MDVTGPNVANFSGVLPDLRGPKGQCFDTNSAQIPSLLWNEDSLLGVHGDHGLQCMATDPSPFSAVDVGAAQQVKDCTCGMLMLSN